MNKLRTQLAANWAQISQSLTFIVAFLSAAGSLYFSEIMLLEPCKLCWYQRILMYPLVVLNAVAIMRKEARFYAYNLVLSVPGFLIAVYHYVIQMRGEAVTGFAACTAGGKSCTEIDWTVGGFLTIPLLSALAFLFVTLLNLVGLFLARKR